MPVEITGWGKCLPPAVLSNDDLSRFSDTSDRWIRERTGIRERRVSHVTVAELSRVAALRALASAGLQPGAIDAVILATASPDLLIPCTASRIQLDLGLEKAAAFDLNAGCSGFVYGLAMANGLVETGVHERILLIGAEHLTWYMNLGERDTAVLFGDGAGAVVLEPCDRGTGVLAAHLGCDGAGGPSLMIPEFGTSAERWTGPVGRLTVQFNGREIFRGAVAGMADASLRVLRQAGLNLDQVDLAIPHQANLRIINAVAKRLGIGMDRVMVNLQKYGNISAASIPVALTEALEQGRIEAGNAILMMAFGAGFTWAAAVLRWGDRVAHVMETEVELPPCAQTALELFGAYDG